VNPAGVRGPDFFIVGSLKAGTTALNSYLAAHPDIFMARKDMHGFGSDLPLGPMTRKRAWSDYVASFSEAGDAQRVGETSGGYLYSKRAAQEIKEYRANHRHAARPGRGDPLAAHLPPVFRGRGHR
jgi:hypothetical protein